ncbi:MAG: DUF4412 domain-containing protein [Bacteroidetes bacterium]|nr:DUF4412 domain-containing protein [Bacteroidota bacterium]
MNNKSDTTSLSRIYCLDGNCLEENFAVFDTTRKSYTLYLKEKPKCYYNLLPNQKYEEVIHGHAPEYKIKFDKYEKVNGYDCAKIYISQYNTDGDYTTVWISKDIKDYNLYLDATVNTFDFSILVRSLKKQNLEGIPVRILYTGSSTGFRFEFSRVDSAVIDLNMFALDKFSIKQKEKGISKEELKNQNKISEEVYQAMKAAEEQAKKEARKNKKGR